MPVAELVRVERRHGQGSTWADWQARMQSFVAGVEYNNSGTADVQGELLAFDFAGARFWYLHSEAQLIIRRRPKLRPAFTPMAIIQVQGETRLTQLGRTCDIAAGSFAFVDAASPLVLESTAEFQHLYLQFPATCFSPAEFRKTVAVSTDGSWRMDSRFQELAREVWTAAPQLTALEHSTALNSLVSLCGLTSAFRLRHSECEPPVRVARAMALIEHNLGEAWLTPQAVADAQKVSRRYLDDLFAKSGHRIESWIWERRLLRARDELRVYGDSSHARKSVLQIALDLGFKSPSHFSRTFSARFGVSPREFKKTIQPPSLERLAS